MTSDADATPLKIAVYGGSFDPITYGHIDIARRALTIFDRVVLGVAAHPNKKTLFTTAQRIDLVNQSFADDAVTGRVEARAVTGLLAQLAQQINATAFIRGLRNGVDYENEQPMVIHNRRLADGIETVLLVGDPALGHISSSFVKELASYGADISMMAPPPVVAALHREFETA